MVKTNAIVIADAGPLIHLDELDSLELLSNFGNIIVPDAVWREVDHHHPQSLQSTEVNLIHKNVINFSPPLKIRETER